MYTSLVTPPDEEPVELEEMKLFLKVDSDDDDDVITGLITSARKYAEEFTRRSFITQTWVLALDEFPAGDVIELPRPPVSSAEVTYKDTEGDESEFSDVILSGDRLVLDYLCSWPSVSLYPADPVTIECECGYGDPEDVPEGIKTAIKLLVAHWYEHREAVIVGTTSRQAPLAVESLLYQYRWFG